MCIRDRILTEQKRSIYIITFAPQILHDMNTKVKGYFLGAIAAATYGTNPLFALPLYKDGMDPDSVLFFRYLFAIPILGMMIKGRGRSFKIEHKAAVPLIVMGLLVAFSSLALFQSYNYMEEMCIRDRDFVVRISAKCICGERPMQI